MTKINQLKDEAIRSSALRKHALGGWTRSKSRPETVETASCTRCGATVTVNTNPRPNEIDVGGRAVAVTCPNFVPEAVAKEITETTYDMWWDRNSELSKEQVSNLVQGDTDLETLWFEDLLPRNHYYLLDMEKELIKQKLKEHGIEATVEEYFEQWPACTPAVDPNMAQLVRNTHAYIGLEIGVEFDPNSKDYADHAEALDLFEVDPEQMASTELQNAPAMPERTNPAVDPAELQTAWVNMFYPGSWVALLSYRNLARVIENAEAIREKGIVLEAGTNLIMHSFYSGSSSTIVTLTRDLQLSAEQVSDLYHDGGLGYGVQRTCSLTARAWEGRWHLPEA